MLNIKINKMQKSKSINNNIHSYLGYMLNILCLFLLLSLLSSCAKVESHLLDSEVSVFQDYYVTFNKTKNTTVAEADFRAKDEKGPRLQLSGPSEIKVNDRENYEFSNIFTLHFYKWKYNSITDVEFVYKKEHGKIFKNTIKSSDGLWISIPSITTISKKGLQFDWSGQESDGENSSIICTIVPKSNENTRILSLFKHGRTVQLTSENLKLLNVGEEVTLTLRRMVDLGSPKEADGGAGGKMFVVMEDQKDLRITN
ncbi:hypothetical protein H7F33_10035 [Pedobacter sp. PAMC26386]|nr:hypothetical protein H7F33_10035 [Pedobacter sp. PAMC26386]